MINISNKFNETAYVYILISDNTKMFMSIYNNRGYPCIYYYIPTARAHNENTRTDTRSETAGGSASVRGI